jgi:hypothetical protein
MSKPKSSPREKTSRNLELYYSRKNELLSFHRLGRKYNITSERARQIFYKLEEQKRKKVGQYKTKKERIKK